VVWLASEWLPHLLFGLIADTKGTELAWRTTDDSTPVRSSDVHPLISEVGSLQNSNICQTRLSLPIVIKPVKAEANSTTMAAPCFLIDGNFVDESFINCVVDADVEIQGELIEEYFEVELPDMPAGDAVCDDEHSNLVVANDGESLSSYDDDYEPVMSGGSVYEMEELGVPMWDGTSNSMLQSDKTVERRLRKKEQNKTAALRYRLKKRIERGSMQSEYDLLLKRNIELKTKVEQMVREIAYLRELINEMGS
jgi:hypothetical protein